MHLWIFTWCMVAAASYRTYYHIWFGGLLVCSIFAIPLSYLNSFIFFIIRKNHLKEGAQFNIFWTKWTIVIHYSLIFHQPKEGSYFVWPPPPLMAYLVHLRKNRGQWRIFFNRKWISYSLLFFFLNFLNLRKMNCTLS